MVGTDKTGQPRAHNHIGYCTTLEYWYNDYNNPSATNTFYAKQQDTKWSYLHDVTEMCITVILPHGKWYSSIHEYLLETTTTTYCASHSQILSDVKDVHVIMIIIWTTQRYRKIALHWICDHNNYKWQMARSELMHGDLKLSALSLDASCV